MIMLCQFPFKTVSIFPPGIVHFGNAKMTAEHSLFYTWRGDIAIFTNGVFR